MLQIDDRAVDLRGEDRVALVHERARRFQIAIVGRMVARHAQQRAHRAARAPADGDDPAPVARQRRAVVAQEADRRLEIDQRDGRLADGPPLRVAGFAPAAAAGHVDQPVSQVLLRIAARAAQPGMRHLHVAGRVVFKHDGHRRSRVAPAPAQRIRRAVRVQIGLRHEDGEALELGDIGLLRVEDILQAPAAVLRVKRPFVPAIRKLCCPVDDRDLLRHGNHSHSSFPCGLVWHGPPVQRRKSSASRSNRSRILPVRWCSISSTLSGLL